MISTRTSILATLFLCSAVAMPVQAKKAKQAASSVKQGDDDDAPAQKQKRRRRVLSSTPWGKTLGIGMQLGGPSALTAKLKLEPNSAVVITIGGGWGWTNAWAGELSVGYVVHPGLVGNYQAFNLSWYIGGAVDMILRGDPNYKQYYGSIPYYGGYAPVGLGAHIPLGLDFQMRAFPLSLYGEITPGVDMFPGMGPRLGAAVGARFFI